jgi:phenylacetic acid degradation protein
LENAVPCYSLEGVIPVVHPTAFVHATAVLIGDVIVGPNCYVGPAAVLRGDFGRIELRAGANVQDTCVVHGFPGRDTVVAEDGHVGHGAVLHNCTIGRDAMVGMNAVVMDDAIVGESAVIAACSFVPAGMHVPARTLVAGTPARVRRELNEDEIDRKRQGTRAYQDLTRRCLATLQEAAPLAELEPGRPRLQVPMDLLMATKAAKGRG